MQVAVQKHVMNICPIVEHPVEQVLVPTCDYLSDSTYVLHIYILCIHPPDVAHSPSIHRLCAFFINPNALLCIALPNLMQAYLKHHTLNCVALNALCT